jgi:hypothetical protein
MARKCFIPTGRTLRSSHRDAGVRLTAGGLAGDPRVTVDLAGVAVQRFRFRVLITGDRTTKAAQRTEQPP